MAERKRDTSLGTRDHHLSSRILPEPIRGIPLGARGSIAVALRDEGVTSSRYSNGTSTLSEALSRKLYDDGTWS